MALGKFLTSVSLKVLIYKVGVVIHVSIKALSEI